MSQEDLQAAILSLEDSTAAIHRQGDILKNQRQYLDSLKSQRFEDSVAEKRTRRLASQNLALAVG